MFNRLILFLFVISNITATAQLRFDTLGWQPPVDIPIYLSGNFAELRTGHLHAGIDIKTQGKEGFKIYAVQDGYISRIKVSSSGYGNAIYIVHPDGYTSVYGHLKEYSIQLEKYVRAIQYERQSFQVDIFPERGELLVNKGDIIGLSGNSGSSAGPHLHFEIRDTRNSHPMNGLFLGYDIKDNIPPKMEYLYVYPQDENSTVNGKNNNHYYSLKKPNGYYALRQGDTLKAKGNIGFGLKVNDYLNGSVNRCGVYELKAFVDDELFFHEKFDGFSFGETRYINSLMDYRENVKKKRKLHKLYLEPNNNLSVYVDVLNRGILNFSKSSKFRKITIEAYDAYFNTSHLTFYVEFDKTAYMAKSKKNDKIVIPWQQSFDLDTLGLAIQFEKSSFYDTLKMNFSVDTVRYEGNYSPIYNIHNRFTPIHKYFEISVEFDSVVELLQDKLLLAYWHKDKFSAVGGVVENGRINNIVRKLGTYTVVIDTVKPTIIPLGDIADSNNLSNSKTIKFKIEDDFSGIDSYKGTINGVWVLFKHDAKNSLITYEFDQYMPEQGVFEVEIDVVDKRGNSIVYSKECVINTL